MIVILPSMLMERGARRVMHVSLRHNGLRMITAQQMKRRSFVGSLFGLIQAGRVVIRRRNEFKMEFSDNA